MEKVNSNTSLNVLHVNSTSDILYMICKFQLIFLSIVVFRCMYLILFLSLKTKHDYCFVSC
jgi:hypothetical protein